MRDNQMTVEESMSQWSGYGKTSAKKIMTAICKARTSSWIASSMLCGIRNIGKSTARDIANELKTVDMFFECVRTEGLFEKHCGRIDGIGPVVIDSFETHFGNTETYTNTFRLRVICDIQDMPANTDGPKPLTGEVICFTGGIERFTRDQCLIIASELGAKTTNSAAKKTTILVAGDNVGAKKIEAAEKFGCQIKDPQWFYDVVDAAVADGYKLDVMV